MHINIPAGLSGYYHVGCAYEWDTNGTGYRFARICKTTTNQIDCASSTFIAQGAENAATANMNWTEAQSVYYLAAGDVLHCAAWQNSGGNRTISGQSGASDHRMVFWAVLVAQ
jgi:hypothetical protein